MLSLNIERNFTPNYYLIQNVVHHDDDDDDGHTIFFLQMYLFTHKYTSGSIDRLWIEPVDSTSCVDTLQQVSMWTQNEGMNLEWLV